MKKILIVDDEILIGMHTQAILEKHNYNATTVISGEKALAAIEEGNTPDLVLMDIDLGKDRIDGVETSRKINENHDIPVVFHSGHTDRETIDKTKAVTKYGYVHKVPGNEMYLTSSIEMALTLHETNKRLREKDTALEIAKEKSEEYLSIAGVMIVAINREGIVTLANKRACQALGYDKNDIEGKNWIENFIPERIRKEMMSLLREINRGKMDFVEYHENNVLLKSGEERIISWHNSLLIDDRGNVTGHLCSGEDITERKAVDFKLQESEVRFRSIIEDTEAGYFYYDKNGIIQDVNDSWMKMYKYSSEDGILGKHFTEVQKVEDVDRAKEFVSGIMHGESKCRKGELSRKCKDDTIGYHTFSAKPVVKEDEVLGIEGFIFDTTERHQMEDQIKQALIEKEILMKEMYHRVKNNLAMVSSLINLHRGNEENEKSRNRLEELRNQINSIALIHEKLYHREDNSAMDFRKYVEDIVASLFFGYKSNKVKIKLDIQDIFLDISTSIPLGLIVNELTTNALKYGFTNGGLHEFLVQMRKGPTDENYILRVKNTGNPFPEDIDFRKTESLGMQLVCILSKQLRGSVELNKNGCTEFLVTIPCGRSLSVTG
jgi:two-component system, sensor histidine kinase PdtaS